MTIPCPGRRVLHAVRVALRERVGQDPRQFRQQRRRGVLTSPAECYSGATVATHGIPGITGGAYLLDQFPYEGPELSPTGQVWNKDHGSYAGVGIYRDSTTSLDAYDMVAYVTFHALRTGATGEPPAATIITPADGATYWTGQPLTTAYSCSDYSGTGITSCTGTVASGSPLDTTAAGTYSISATATDGTGATTTSTSTYHVVDDATPPNVSILSPKDGYVYVVGDSAGFTYSCSDSGGSQLATCDPSQTYGTALAPPPSAATASRSPRPTTRATRRPSRTRTRSCSRPRRCSTPSTPVRPSRPWSRPTRRR